VVLKWYRPVVNTSISSAGASSRAAGVAQVHRELHAGAGALANPVALHSSTVSTNELVEAAQQAVVGVGQ
jgi:hypothetical protein